MKRMEKPRKVRNRMIAEMRDLKPGQHGKSNKQLRRFRKSREGY